ncbi:MAG: hypothetical protein FJ083_16395 [Cyanobacteria bacterium K_Offshore_surface_m2_239]|nr:hypothetical protein [Cyanobacteria bacterium K_Offshore_surface_m2_239]
MTTRKVNLVLICEDRQHEAFVRRFLRELGWETRRLRVNQNPKGRGSGEQWVRTNYVQEVMNMRQRPHVAMGLIVTIDQDTERLNREHQLLQALTEAGQKTRCDQEKIAHIIPARNIETWLAYLSGKEVDETTVYPRLARESECQALVLVLKSMCEAKALRKPAPPSLEKACGEFHLRVPGA